MDELVEAFVRKGLHVPPGLVSLIRNGRDKKTVFRLLWAAAKFGGDVGKGYRTFTFPKEIRAAVRERFPYEEEKHYDAQYEAKPGVYHLTLEEMSVLRYPPQK